jgi:hypothetical protein
MKKLKKLLAVIMIIALMIPCTAFAATSSPTTTKISKASIKVSGTYTYNETMQTPTFKVTYDGKTLKKGTDYKVTACKGQKAGYHKITIQGIGKFTGTKTVYYQINKATQSDVKVTTTYKTKKASTFAKKAKSYSIKVTGVKGGAKVTYSTNSKKITVKNGKITLAKGIKKGTYKVTVKIGSTANRKPTTKTLKITVKK